MQRQALTESSIRDAALAERRILSQDLHDHLAQNLSYLRFKLDQFTRAGRQPKIEDILPDLELMHGIAFESSEIVRGRLSQLMPGQAFHLSQLIQDRVRQIAMRSKIEISIDEQGLPLALSRHDLRHIYYIAYEALSNVEKHAQASQALVELSWGEDGLTLEITDDGRGFDPGSVEPREHFGLVIMRQRVEALQGRIEFSTPPQGGTRITAWLPISDPNSQMIESDPQLIDTDA
jgi:signal transduction histidine kinase